MTLPTDPKARKAIPVYSGFIKYFPRAICAVAELSRIGNDQHNPGKPLHWDRSKSGDEKDALMRHLIDQTIDGDQAADTDGVLHATKKAWRAMADLEKILEGRPAEDEAVESVTSPAVLDLKIEIGRGVLLFLDDQGEVVFSSTEQRRPVTEWLTKLYQAAGYRDV